MNRQSNTYFFFDKGILMPQGMRNAGIHIVPAVKDEENNPMFTEGWRETPALPWEIRYDNAYPNVIYDEEQGIYHCYYTMCTQDEDARDVPREERARRPYRPTAGRRTSLGYARSRDGIHWEKPNLGFVDFEGSRDNNILLLNAHGTGVFLDKEETDRSKRYKLVTMVDYPHVRSYHMAVGFSEDGVHFGRLTRWPENKPPADSHNFPLRDPRDGLFKMTTRVWDNGVRVSAVCQSHDFINWSQASEMARGTGFHDQIYSMPVFLHHGLYLGLASIFTEGDRDADDFDTVSLEMYAGTSLRHLDPVASGEQLIKRGEGKYPDGAFDCGCIYAAAPLPMGDKLCIYYMGGNGQHTNFRETSFGRAFIDAYRIGYVSPKRADDEMVVPLTQMTFFGNDIELLCDIEEGGALSLSVRDSWNKAPLEGFAEADAELTKTAEGWTRIRFARRLDAIPLGSACLSLRAKRAKVYAIRGDLTVSNPRYYGGVTAP